MIDLELFFRQNLMKADFGVDRAQAKLEAIRVGGYGISTGIEALDPYFMLLKSEMTTIAARPGTGKTAIAMQITHAVITQLEKYGKPGLACVFSAEMDTETLLLREACALEKIPLWRVLNNDFSGEEFDRIHEALEKLRNERLYIDESPAPTIEHMVEQLAVLKEEFGVIALVVFDYAELSGEFDRVQSERIAKISRGLKAIAKRFETPVLVLSQMNREIETRSDRQPNLRDLMHGGEREPDRVIFMIRPWTSDKSEPKELVYAHVVKNRNGPLGQAALFFDQEIMHFSSAEIIQMPIEGDE